MGRVQSGIVIMLTALFIGGMGANLSAEEKVWPERLRGFCVGNPSAGLANEKIFKRLKKWHVNLLTVNLTYDKKQKLTPGSDCPLVPLAMEPYRGMLQRLDKIVKLAKKHKIFLNICTGAAVGNDKINVASSSILKTQREDAEKRYLKNVIDLTVYLAKKYKDEPTVIAWGFISEPHTPWLVKNWSIKVVPDFIKAIRAVDTNSYLIISAGLWGFPDFGEPGRVSKPFTDPANKVLYGWHDYAPHSYTHQGVGNAAMKKKRPRGVKYPGILKMFPGSKPKLWNREAMQEYMQPALDFMKKYNVKMFVGEFGVIRWAPGADKYLDDKASLFEEYGISWSCHNYAGAWDGWNVTVSADAHPGNVTDGGIDTPRLEVLKKYFKRNKVFND